MLSYSNLQKEPKLLQTFTGLDEAEFLELLVAFDNAWQADERKRASRHLNRKRKAGGGRKPGLELMSDRLLFILVYMKLYPIQELQAFMFGVSQSQANRLIQRTAGILQEALQQMGYLPERDGQQLKQVLAQCETLTFTQDGTERRRQRPKENQEVYYSGKKKCHSVKNHLVVHPDNRRVWFLSKTFPGSKHDKKIADEAALSFPDRAVVEQDTGFQGYAQDNIIIVQPKKKARGKDLSTADRFLNKVIASSRIIVENVIAGIKRCRIVKDVLRNWKTSFDDLVMAIACGLHNLCVSFRHAVETINLLDLI